jgi:hypothetical protein
VAPLSARLLGWRRSADRTCLHLNSLLTGNLTGKNMISGLMADVFEHKTAAPQGLFDEFPKQNIRELLFDNREFWTAPRE